jgi:hypothetical protein
VKKVMEDIQRMEGQGYHCTIAYFWIQMVHYGTAMYSSQSEGKVTEATPADHSLGREAPGPYQPRARLPVTLIAVHTQAACPPTSPPSERRGRSAS